MVTHLEPDTLECEVKWALGSTAANKANGGDGIPAELFKILNDDAIKVGFPGGSDGKESACNVGDLGSIPGSRRSLGGGNGNPLLPGESPWTEEPGGLQSMGSQRVGMSD